jgi:hypothetical protein
MGWGGSHRELKAKPRVLARRVHVPCGRDDGCIFQVVTGEPLRLQQLKHAGSKTMKSSFLTDPRSLDRALIVLGSNTAKQATLTALLDTSTHFRPPLTHTSHHRPALVNLSRFIVSSVLTHNRFRRFSTCVSAVSGVSLVGVSLLSADVAVTVVRPEVISQRVFISRGRTKAHWKALVQAHTIGQ